MRLTKPWSVALAVAAIVAAVLTFGRGLWSAFFTHNDKYLIGAGCVEIPGDSLAKTPKEIQDITGIREGVNIFAIDAEDARERLLQSSLNFKDVSISKFLPKALKDDSGAITGAVPARVKIDVTPRIPVARFWNEHQTSQALDDEALVFAILQSDEQKYADIPVIMNEYEPVSGPAFLNGKKLRNAPGTPTDLETRVARAVQILVVYAKEPLPLIKIKSLDVSDEHYVAMETDRYLKVRFAWADIKNDETIARAFRVLKEALENGGYSSARRFDVLLEPHPRIVASSEF